MKCIFALFMCFNVFATDCSYFDKLEPWQRHNLRIAYNYGSPYDYSYTLMAIAMKESNLGRWKINYHSNDFGLFQVNINTAANILGVTNYYKKLELAEQLVHNHNLNATIALDVLMHFEKTSKSWKEVIMSYNEGYAWRKDKNSFKKAENYYTDVAAYVKLIKQCPNWSN